MRKSFMVPEPGTPHRLPGRIWELWWWSDPGGTGEGGARRCQAPAAAGLPQPRAPSPAQPEPHRPEPHRTRGFCSAAEQRTGEKLILRQNKMEVFCILNDLRPQGRRLVSSAGSRAPRTAARSQPAAPGQRRAPRSSPGLLALFWNLLPVPHSSPGRAPGGTG